MSTVTVGIEVSFDLEETHASLVKDMLLPKIGKAGGSTMLTDNIGIYDYSPDEKIVSVTVE